MTVYSKFNVIYRLQKWLDSVPGQTFMNYAYSWGASIVIAGTLFKLTHLPGANFMLFLGMGTEIFVFFLSAFDRPFDKTADGKDLPTHIDEEEIEEEYEEDMEEREREEEAQEAAAQQSQTQPQAPAGMPGGTIIIGGAAPAAVSAAPAATSAAASAEPVSAPAATAEETTAAVAQPAAAVAAQQTAAGLQQWVAQQQQVSPEMAEATGRYVDELNNLTDIIAQVAEQSKHLTRDSEEMENLNRTLTGICKIYEMHLKEASAQIGTGDKINDRLNKMADQIEQLNAIYTRMIEAMTTNMRAAAPSAQQ